MQLPNFKQIRPNKTWAVLGIAVGIGILAALGARGYLSSRLAEIEARGQGRTVNLIVAKRELRKGDVISPDTVAVRPIPIDYAHSQAIAPENFERVEGQPLAVPVKAGEMILWSLLEGKRVPTFSARVAEGRRAITVPVDEINSISGLLEPSDVIDLVASVEKDSKWYTFTFLQNITVLATGQRSIDDPKSGEKRLYTTVTLDTTPEDAQRIISARQSGKLTALLRNPQDKTPLPTTDLAAFFARGMGDEFQVPVLYGGRSGKIPLEGLRLGARAVPDPGDDLRSVGLANARAASPSDAPVINDSTLRKSAY